MEKGPEKRKARKNNPEKPPRKKAKRGKCPYKEAIEKHMVFESLLGNAEQKKKSGKQNATKKLDARLIHISEVEIFDDFDEEETAETTNYLSYEEQYVDGDDDQMSKEEETIISNIIKCALVVSHSISANDNHRSPPPALVTFIQMAQSKKEGKGNNKEVEDTGCAS
ncbi:hypothetical protein Cgig2_028514 [Carnegiea gigantea]|uniref:Uncharacterized protein n=1 Tax=Carnegiea gigantea TaxID=171969 RepID=A0A9Q1JLY3_9CARY|nr:hypothetical protein Cgig2_028514 [Carnegiea gigantea]